MKNSAVYILVIIFLLSCTSTDKIDLDSLEVNETAFNKSPDTVQKVFKSYVGPELIINNSDTTKMYPNHSFDFVFINKCNYQSTLKSIPWIINSWFDHYELIIEKQGFLVTKKLSPPFVLFNDTIYFSNLVNSYEIADYYNSNILYIDLKGKLEPICIE
jgi:hypothetical protein